MMLRKVSDEYLALVKFLESFPHEKLRIVDERINGRGHAEIRCRSGFGDNGVLVFNASLSPSDVRSVMNCIRSAKKTLYEAGVIKEVPVEERREERREELRSDCAHARRQIAHWQGILKQKEKALELVV